MVDRSPSRAYRGLPHTSGRNPAPWRPSGGVAQTRRFCRTGLSDDARAPAGRHLRSTMTTKKIRPLSQPPTSRRANLQFDLRGKQDCEVGETWLDFSSACTLDSLPKFGAHVSAC